MMKLPITGSKKGGSSGNVANTLRSRARARILDLISEGPIVGLVSAAKSIYFDETAVQAADDSYNFVNVIWTEHKGLPDEGHFTGQSAVETPISVETQVKISPGPVVRTVTEVNTDAIRIIVRIPALVNIDGDGATTPTSLSYAIDVKPNGGAYAVVHTENIVNEKTGSPYQKSHRIVLPVDGAPWDVRVRRITADSSDEKLQNDLYWESYTILVEGKFSYPNSAIVGFELNAEDVGSTLPSRFYHVKGLKIQVPENYDPETGIYTGAWNGVFKTAWSNNPTWIFYDLITNDRYGLGEFIDASGVDKWSLYTIAQYCDELVPSGFRDITNAIIYERRFTFDGVINTREEAFSVLRKIATAWRGMSYFTSGQVFPSADMPADPIKLVTPANVIDGKFDYSGIAMKARHSVALVQWNDPADFYRPATEAIIDDEMIQKFGWREKSVTFVGCKSRGAARRYGKWILDVEKNETETVTYVAGFDHADVRPGSIISIADPAKARIRLGGRLKTLSLTTAYLDAPIFAEPGVVYSIIMTLADGTTLITKEIASFSGPVYTNGVLVGYNEAVFSVPLSTIETVDGSMYVVTSPNKLPTQYRVFAMRETGKNKFTITALLHDATKYSRVELGIEFDASTYSRPSARVPAPGNITTSESLYVSEGVQRSALNISWSKPSQVVKFYTVKMVSPFRGLVNLGDTEDMSLDALDLEPGAYTFFVYATGMTGYLSQPAEVAVTINGWSSADAPVITAIQLANAPGSSEFAGRNIHIKWVNTLPASIPLGDAVTTDLGPLYKNNVIQVYDNTTNSLLRTDTVYGSTYTYSYDMNFADHLALGSPTTPGRSIRFEITLNDNVGRSSAEVSAVFTNSLPARITPTVIVDANKLHFSYAKPGDLDFEGVKIWASTTDGFNPAVVNPVYQGSDTSFTFVGNSLTTYYTRMATYDAFNQSGINISAQVAHTTSAISAGNILDNAITNAKLADNAVGTSEIANDAITALKIASRTISARELLIYNFENLVPDNQVETSAAWTTTDAWSRVTTTDTAYKSRGVLLHTFAGGAGYLGNAISTQFPVDGGKEYQVGFVQKRTGSTGYVLCRIYWFDNQGAEISFSTVSNVAVDATYQERNLVVTAPALAQRAEMRFSVDRTNSNGNVTISYPYCFRRKDGSLIVDGAITANKIAVNAITADKIAAGVITADKIVAGTITADRIIANGISQVYNAVFAGSVQTNSNSAYAAIDTTNCALSITVPANALIFLLLSCTGTISTTSSTTQTCIFRTSDSLIVSSVARLFGSVGGSAGSSMVQGHHVPGAGTFEYRGGFRTGGSGTATIVEARLTAIVFYR